MSEEASSWYVALIYSMGSVLISVFLLLPVVVLLFVFEDLVSGTIQLLLLMGALLAIWWGTKFTTDLIQKRYLISDKQDVVNISLLYFLSFIILAFLVLLLLSSFFPIDVVVFFAAIVLLFYLGSKRHLKEVERTYSSPQK